jgi:hypothetical protein
MTAACQVFSIYVARSEGSEQTIHEITRNGIKFLVLIRVISRIGL